MATPHFENNFLGILSGLSLRAHVPNFNHVSLAILELYHLPPPQFTGSRDHGH